MSGGRLLSFLPKTVWQTMYESHCRSVEEQWASVVFVLNATSVVFLTGSRFLVHACF